MIVYGGGGGGLEYYLVAQVEQPVPARAVRVLGGRHHDRQLLGYALQLVHPEDRQQRPLHVEVFAVHVRVDVVHALPVAKQMSDHWRTSGHEQTHIFYPGQPGAVGSPNPQLVLDIHINAEAWPENFY